MTRRTILLNMLFAVSPFAGRLARFTRIASALAADQHDEPPPAGRKALIEFGWDEPDTAFLREHQAAVEQSPFDGCVFHVNTGGGGKPPENFAWLAWGRRRFAEADFTDAVADLRAIAWKRFHHNFLRLNVTPGDVDWFDDHDAILENARHAARLAREGRCRGILLDTEQYQGPLFNFRKQKPADGRGWKEYAAQARRRGREVMEAFQAEYPGLTIFLTFGPSLLWKQSREGRIPLADCEYGLLVPFIEGMIESAGGENRIIDGFESSYSFQKAEQFAAAHETMTVHVPGLLSHPNDYRRVVSPGFGIWLDYEWPKRGWNTEDLEQNYFSPERFEAALTVALRASREYVWVYAETPRWWNAEGQTVALPEAYAKAVRNARAAAKLDIDP